MKKNIYSKENLESFVFDLLKYLYRTRDYYDERLSKDIYIYSMNKRYYIDEDNFDIMAGKAPIHIEDNVKVEDYFEYYTKESLTLSMDARLNEYLYYYDVPGCVEVADRVDKIFKKHGFYMDFGTNYLLLAYEIGGHREL